MDRNITKLLQEVFGSGSGEGMTHGEKGCEVNQLPEISFFQTIQVVTFSLFFGGNLPLKVAFWYIPSEKMYTLSKSYISITILGRLYMEYDWCTL